MTATRRIDQKLDGPAALLRARSATRSYSDSPSGAADLPSAAQASDDPSSPRHPSQQRPAGPAGRDHLGADRRRAPADGCHDECLSGAVCGLAAGHPAWAAAVAGVASPGRLSHRHRPGLCRVVAARSRDPTSRATSWPWRPARDGKAPSPRPTVRHNLGMVRTFFERIIEWDWRRRAHDGCRSSPGTSPKPTNRSPSSWTTPPRRSSWPPWPTIPTAAGG